MLPQKWDAQIVGIFSSHYHKKAAPGFVLFEAWVPRTSRTWSLSHRKTRSLPTPDLSPSRKQNLITPGSNGAQASKGTKPGAAVSGWFDGSQTSVVGCQPGTYQIGKPGRKTGDRKPGDGKPGTDGCSSPVCPRISKSRDSEQRWCPPFENHEGWGSRFRGDSGAWRTRVCSPS